MGRRAVYWVMPPTFAEEPAAVAPYQEREEPSAAESTRSGGVMIDEMVSSIHAVPSGAIPDEAVSAFVKKTMDDQKPQPAAPSPDIYAGFED